MSCCRNEMSGTELLEEVEAEVDPAVGAEAGAAA
jgi:hypothetical protein